jgi:carbamoyltransferase
VISIGINYSQMHDSSACIARDGETLFAVAEERLSRLKHDARFPVRAIQACLDFAGVKSADLDYVCFGWPAPRRMYFHDLRNYLAGQRSLNYSNVLNSTRLYASMRHQRGGWTPFERHFGHGKAKVRYVDHHLAHAISAYAFSGFEDAAIVVIDGRGAWEATSIWRGHAGRLEHVLTVPWPNSIGLFYAQFTQYLGFTPNSDEWKVMGLAPYGSAEVDLSPFANPDDHPYRVHTRSLLGPDSSPTAGIEKVLGQSRKPESEINDRHKNVAFAVQDMCERAMFSLVRTAVEQTNCRNLCLVGGVALNSKANGKILASGMIDKLFVQPAAGDDGVCLGAALAPYLDGGGQLPMHTLRDASLGQSISDQEIERTLQTYKVRYSHLDEPAKTAAELIAFGKIVGWFQGRMEFGPRALGNRSILADPRDPEMNARVNNAVKFREWWRPFAPSMLAEASGEYLENAPDSPFMIITAQVRPEKRSVIPSVTHVDGSARPQTVERQIRPLYWNLIKRFGEITGVPVVMNTSFNLRGEAIVSSPTDAIRTFYSSGLDALVIGNFLVEK